jgi:hypothetical protein
VQDSKKKDQIVQKPQKFVPQEVEIAPLDDITAQIEKLVTMSESDRTYEQMYRPIYDETHFICDIDCQCFPCKRGDCRNCTGVERRYEARDPRYGPSRF